MSAPNNLRQSGGTLSTESSAQVVVRADKVYLCSSCGTLVEVPADVVGQLVLAVNHAPQETTPPISTTASTPATTRPATSTSKQHAGGTSGTASKSTQSHVNVVEDRPSAGFAPKARPARPRRPMAPQPVRFVGQTIDGLTVPSAGQLDRALKWVSFHLRVLDRQGSEVKRLKKLLKQRPCTTRQHHPRKRNSCRVKPAPLVPRPRRFLQTDKLPIAARAQRLRRNQQRHAHADVSMAPRLKPLQAFARSTDKCRRTRILRRRPGRGPPG